MRSTTKRAAEKLLGSGTARRLGNLLHRRAALVLAWHNITPVPVQTGDRSLHLPFDDFRRQLDLLAGLPVVPLDQVRAGMEGPAVALTFDDAYAGAIELGLPELSARGLPATVCVAPGILGRDALWWDLLAVPGAGVPADLRARCLEQFAGDHDRIMGEAARAGWWLGPVQPDFRIATQAEVTAALGPLHTVSAHSRTHRNLAVLPGRELPDELEGVLRWLEAAWPGRVVPWIAYPYGAVPADLAPVASAGYQGGLLVTGGWHRPGPGQPLRTPRTTIPWGLSSAGFAARLSGLWPS